MAAEPMIWAMKLLPLLANDSQRVVLLSLAWRSNSDGLLWPSVATMALDLGKSERALRRTIRELDADEGLVNANPQFRTSDGSQKSNYYHLMLNVTPQELLKRRKQRNGSAIMSTSRKRFDLRMESFYESLSQWAECLTMLREQINIKTFDTWFAPLKFRAIKKRTLILAAPDEIHVNYFQDGRNRRLIIDCAKRAFAPKPITFIYIRQN